VALANQKFSVAERGCCGWAIWIPCTFGVTWRACPSSCLRAPYGTPARHCTVSTTW